MPYLLGGLFIVSGSLIVYGAITGRLAAMLGSLVGVGTATGQSSYGVPNSVGNAAKNAVNSNPGLSLGTNWGESLANWAKKHL